MTVRRMPAGSGIVVAVIAVILGALTGLFVLPDPGPVLAAWGSGPATSPGTGVPGSAAPSTPDRTPTGAGSGSATPSATSTTGRGPVTEDNLVTVQAFAEAGLKVTVYPMNGATDPKSSVTECTDEREVGAQTLADLTGRDPAVTGNWDYGNGSGSALQVLAVAESPELAEVYAKRLAAAQTICQDEPKGHFVYGPVHTEDVAAGSSARWFGRWDGEQNTTGRAPADSEPCGGVVIAANGTHFTVLEVFICADSAGMAVLAKNAAEQLG